MTQGENVLFTDTAPLSPVEIYDGTFPTDLETLSGCSVSIEDADGALLVSYTEKEPELEPTPEPADPLLPPEQLKSTEELYLGGLHLEQYRHATFAPEDYYLEGLKRDPSDIRLNNAYGLLLYRRGCFEESIPYFRKAIEKPDLEESESVSRRMLLQPGTCSSYDRSGQ